MDDAELLSMMTEWNFWGGKIDVGIERERYINNVLRLLKAINIVALSGIRRSGKSTIGLQALKKLIDSGIDINDTLVIRLDDERLLNLDYATLLRIYDLYTTHIKSSQESTTYVLLDEAQEVNGWERFVRGLADRGKAKFLVTGSSAKLLSSEYTTLLSGRHVEVRIFPLDFKEYLSFHSIKVDSKLEFARNLERIKKLLEEYLSLGGLPQITLNKDLALELLDSHFDTIIVKDVVRRYRIRDENKIRTLAKYYISSVASRVTFNSVSKFLKIPVKTVERYSKYLENSYLIYFLRNFSFSVKAVENSPRKVHVVDNGFIKLFNPRLSRGHLLESLVFQHLYRYSLNKKDLELYYWYDGNYEIDFLLKSPNNILPIQVAYEINDQETMKRELRAIDKFKEKVRPVDRTLLVTYHTVNESVGENEVILLPAYSFLTRYEEVLGEIMDA
ncbi:ATP-binding protein [Metallosphaera tengchongensis]|uniref:ATP-binding protein n=1 Tax=Metallosphaera tengchongensis TaxID=1532350 RepID=A0A6N0NTI9_9CREN|nr:ATP-binding protein [Metallosphaera tengchongensis]QKR00184.1 ATP-binding protein [Metallosphaera tengchongensis]